MSEQKMPEGMAEMIDQANAVSGAVAAQSKQIQAGQKEEWARDLLRNAALHGAQVENENMILKRQLDEARNECERLHRALAEIREEWCGAECGEPVTAQEAYAIGLCKRMYVIACDSISVAQFEKMEQAAVKLATAMKGTE